MLGFLKKIFGSGLGSGNIASRSEKSSPELRTALVAQVAALFNPDVGRRDAARVALAEQGKAEYIELVACVVQSKPSPPVLVNIAPGLDDAYFRRVLGAAAVVLAEDGSKWTIQPLISLFWAAFWHTKLYHPLFELWVGSDLFLIVVHALGKAGDDSVIVHLDKAVEVIERGTWRASEKFTNIEVVDAVKHAVSGIRNRAIATSHPIRDNGKHTIEKP